MLGLKWIHVSKRGARALANLVDILRYMWSYFQVFYKLRKSFPAFERPLIDRIVVVGVDKKVDKTLHVSVYQSAFVVVCRALWHQGANLSKNPAAASVCSDTGVWTVSHLWYLTGPWAQMEKTLKTHLKAHYTSRICYGKIGCELYSFVWKLLIVNQRAAPVCWVTRVPRRDFAWWCSLSFLRRFS